MALNTYPALPDGFTVSKCPNPRAPRPAPHPTRRHADTLPLRPSTPLSRRRWHNPGSSAR